MEIHEACIYIYVWFMRNIYIYTSDLTMVYGRYNELVHGVYKPTNMTGGVRGTIYGSIFGGH